MTRIAYIGPSGVFGGVRAIVEHCNGLARRGHDVTFISIDNKPIDWLACQFTQRPANDAGSGYDVAVGTAINTWAAAEQLAPRAVSLFQMAEWLFFPRKSQAYHDTYKAFTDSRVDVMAISDWLYDLATDNARGDWTLVVDSAGSRMKKRPEVARGREVFRIRNGIDPAQFYPDPPIGAGPKLKPRIVIEGYNSNPAKDWAALAFRAVRQLRYFEGYDFDVWGFSQQPAQFEFDQFWQLPPQPMIRQIYSACDIFLKASVYEGAPGPDMEAMACGAAVCRAIEEGDDHLHDKENCLKVEYSDYDGFVSNLRNLLDDEVLRSVFRGNGIAYVRDHYDWVGAVDMVEQALTGSVTPEAAAPVDVAYDLSMYNDMQGVITSWETPQAMYLGEWLRQRLQPRSVIDVGCGPGIYLVPFKPAARVLGVDGAPDAGKALELWEFILADLRQNWSLEKAALERDAITFYKDGNPINDAAQIVPLHFDLSMCIEVAEHLPPDRADYLIDLLTMCSDTCFFSAARPGQVGTGHINLQTKEWWQAKFRARGWELHPLDAELQAALWANEHVRRVQWLLHNSFLMTRMVDNER